MRATLSFGRIAGIPVGAHWSALVGVVLLGQLLALTVLPALAPGRTAAVYWLAGVVGALVLVLSLLVHELAHAVMARRAGLGVRRITLWLLGGVSELAEQPARPGPEVRIALVGPLASLVLCGLFAAGAWAGPRFGAPVVVVAVLSWLATMNLVLGVFNLLPGTPLDGGRVLHGLVWRHTGDRERAARTAAGAGRLIGALLAGLGILLVLQGRWDGLWLVLVGWFLSGAAAAEQMHTVLAERLRGVRAGDVMTRDPRVARGWWTVAMFLEHMLAPDGPRCRVFPVVDFERRLVGVLHLGGLAAVAPTARAATTLREVARPHPGELVVTPDTLLERVLERPLVPGRDLVVVEQDGRVVGVLTTSDLQRIVELRALTVEDGGRRTPRSGIARRG